jgi:hypothetical protein
MATYVTEISQKDQQRQSSTMRALVFRAPNQVAEAYQFFGTRSDGVIKVAIKPKW